MKNEKNNLRCQFFLKKNTNLYGPISYLSFKNITCKNINPGYVLIRLCIV